MLPLIFAFGILAGAFGGICMKIGAGHLGQVEINSVQSFVHFLVRLFTDIPSLSGIFLYFVSAMTWAYLLTKLDLSFVQPILALTYVVTPVLAILIIGESVPPLRWVGILIIILGVYIVAKTPS
jgi:multidrug transporter EmrE-like cation transporter